MSDHVIGFVAKITSKEAGKNNNLIYNLCIEEDGQDDTWYGFGWDEPDFTEGAEIEFDIEWNGDYPNVDVKSVNVLQEGEEKPKPRRPARGGSSGGGRGNGRGGNSSSRGNSRSSSGSSKRSSSSSRGSSKPNASRGGNKASGKGATDSGMSKEDWNNKDKMIRRQACMNTAIKLVGLLQESGVLPKPKTKSDGYDAIVALCDEEAARLYDQYEDQVHGDDGGAPAKRGRNNQDQEYDDDIPE